MDLIRPLDFRLDDLSGEPTRRLVERHLAGMRASSPADCVHALDVDALREPGVTFWSAWAGSEIAGCGALKQLDAQRGEIKSMRVADRFLGRGVGVRWLRQRLVRCIHDKKYQGECRSHVHYTRKSEQGTLGKG